MNILHVCKRFAPSIGGVETHVLEVAREQVARGFTVTVLTQATAASQKQTEIIDGITVIRIPVKTAEEKKAVWKAIGTHSNLFKAANVIQVHDVFWWLLPYYLLIIGKCYTTFHGWETEYPIPISAKLQRYVYAHLSKKTVHIGSWIQKYYWDKPSVVMYGGTTIPKKVPVHTGKLKKAVFLGRLSHDNDIENYVFLANILKEEFSGFSIQWIGDGECKKMCSEVGVVTGFVSNPTDYIAKADVVFAASYLSILQAQAYGKPVVSLYSNPLKYEYLQSLPTRVSLICRDQAVDAYAELSILFEYPERVLQISETAARLTKDYSWQKIVDVYQSLWQK